MYWTPTVGNPVNNTFMRENAELFDDPSWQRGLPPSIVEDIRASLRLMPGILARPGVVPDLAIYRKKFQQLRDAGAELLVGTDSGNPGHFHPNATWLELDAWTNQFGVSPMESILRATAMPAKVMGVERDYGTLEPGKYADVIATLGDPLRHINVLRNPAIVIKHGQRVK